MAEVTRAVAVLVCATCNRELAESPMTDPTGGFPSISMTTADTALKGHQDSTGHMKANYTFRLVRVQDGNP